MLRTRLATESDAAFLAWAILAAARSHREQGWFDIVLDRPEHECLDYLKQLTLTSTRSWWHYSRFRVAEVDGQPAAALCAFRAGDGYPLSQAAMTEVARSLAWSDEEQAAMWSRGAYMFTCVIEADDDRGPSRTPPPSHPSMTRLTRALLGRRGGRPRPGIHARADHLSHRERRRRAGIRRRRVHVR